MQVFCNKRITRTSYRGQAGGQRSKLRCLTKFICEITRDV